jgi:hypothetical protein
MLKLENLPQFLIAEIDWQQSDAVLRGTVTGPRIENGRAWLYVSASKSIIGDIIITPRATFTAPLWAMNDAAVVGAKLPIVDGRWNAYQVSMIVDEQHIWRRHRFTASDAIQFSRQGITPGWIATMKSGKPLPADAENQGVIVGAWDHEHCDLCDQKIGHGGDEFGYVDSEDRWLCEMCFLAYAEKHDLSFLLPDDRK